MSIEASRVVFRSKESVEYEAYDLPPCGPQELVIENEVSLISPGTELSMFTEVHPGFKDPDNHWAEYPFRPGYAAVGRVIEVGAGVTDYQRGDRVFYRGGHSSHSVTDADRVFAVPDGAAPEDAVFARLAQIAHTSISVAPEKPKDVLVFGGGLIGNIAAQVHRLVFDVPVTLIEPNEHRRAKAAACGLATRSSAIEEHGGQTGVLDADRVVEATGIPGVVPIALKSLRREGTLVLLGSTRGVVELDVYEYIHSRHTKMVGAHENYVVADHPDPNRNLERITTQMLEAISAGSLKVAPLRTHLLESSRALEAYRGLLGKKDEYLGVVLRWTPGT
jgi:2-desacetyl-2-hydroxyethyl bacteriochlorophyllide A dehydrogenase